MIGETIGKYEVFEEVGQGGMSVVYRGRDTVLDRPVAIKVLHPHLSNRKDSRQRFEREARAIAKLHHANIVQVYDFSGTDSERAYIIMEFIDGSTLRDFLESHTVRFPEIAAMVGVELCGALEHAHSLGIIHRDIKPENVMIGRDGSVKLTDFGIAQIVDAQAMTVTGTLLGSPAHMSPEMIEGLPMDFRADIFSLGTVLYYVATGELPFSGKNAPLVLKAILEGDYLDAEIANPVAGRRFARIIDRCLSRQPDDRYSDIPQLATALIEYLHGCGLDDEVREELAAFIPSPDAYQADLEPRLVNTLERAGVEALKRNAVATALEYFNRVLAIQPDHEGVLAHIRRIDLRRKSTRFAGAALALLALGGVVIAVHATVDRHSVAPVADVGVVVSLEDATRDSTVAARATAAYVGDLAPTIGAKIRRQRTDSATVTASTGVSAAFEAGGESSSSAGDDVGRPATLDAGAPRVDAGPRATDVGLVEDAVEPAADLVRVVVKVFPLTTRVTVGGTPYTVSELNQGINVDRGSGLVRWNAECDICFGQRGSFQVSDLSRKGFDFQLKLPYKPAKLVVNVAQDTGAHIIVKEGGREIATGSAGRQLAVAMSSGALAERKVEVFVVPRAGGYSPARIDVILKAGALVTYAANLQRKD